MPADFTIGEYSFKVGNLKVKTSLLVFKKLAKTILPAFASAQVAPEGQVGDAFQRVAENLDSLDDLLEAFVPVTQATWPGRDNFTQLNGALVEQVFGGRSIMLLQYIAGCVQGEYGDYLKGNALLGALMARVGVTTAPRD